MEPLKRVRLSTIGLPSSLDDAWKREASAAIALRAAGSGQGRVVGRTPEQVELFRQITEGRAAWKGYSTCADLTGWVLAMLGCRDDRIVNRDSYDFVVPEEQEEPEPPATNEPEKQEDPPGNHWKMGQNISLLCDGTAAVGARFDASPAYLPHKGDIWLIGGEGYGGWEHVGVATADAQVDASGLRYQLPTVEAGQVDAGGQCALPFVRTLRLEGKTVWMAARRMRYVIDVTRVPLRDLALVPASLAVGRAVG